MAIRVTEEEVKQIIPTTLNTIPFIKTANQIVQDRLTDKGLSAGALKMIELWLSAHFISIRDRSYRVQSKKIGEAQETYAAATGRGLQMTPYGQQALMLDTSGTLAGMGKRRASITAIRSTTS